MLERMRARAANERGVAAARDDRYADAVPHYLEAVRLAPSWCDPWFNLGIAYKHTGEFAACLDACERAIAIDARGAGEGAHWNLGVAATALGEWAKARRAWRAVGLTIPDGEGPIDLGRRSPTPVRLNPRSAPEVVWATRIDPARARLDSVPLPASARRYGDPVLHDGEPQGFRRLGGHELPVFDELVLLEPSRYETWSTSVEAPRPEDVEDLRTRLRALDVPSEDWGEVRMLCEQCSLGVPHAHGGTRADAPPQGWTSARAMGVAVRDVDPAPTLDAWASAAPGRAVHGLERVLRTRDA